MRKAILATLMALALAALLPATASAQATGQMRLSINLPNLVILYYYDAVTVNINASDLVADPDIAITPGPNVTDGMTPDLAINPPALGSGGGPDLTDVGLTLRNAWAVRALSTGNVSVTFAANGATMAGGGGGSITVNSVTVAEGSHTDTSTAPTTTPALISIPSPGMSSPAVGDLGMGLDLTSAVGQGTYVGDFTITASVP